MINDRNLAIAKDIPGYVYEMEMVALAYLASCVPKGGKILEVGAYCGKSTASLLAGVNGSTIHTVETWAGDDDFLYPHGVTAEKVRNVFMSRLKPAMDMGRVVVHEGDYREVLPTMEKGSYDLIFIDGPHEAEHAEPTVEMAVPLLTENGTLAFHDAWCKPDPWPGVVKMVELVRATELFGGNMPVQTMAMFRRKQEKD